MINLLPDESKKAYFYARANQKLIKILLGLFVGLIGLIVIGTYGWITIQQSINTNQKTVNTDQALLAKENLTGTENQIQTLSSDFNLIVKVLSNEVVFSTLLTKLANTLPAGANLTGLVITTPSGGSGIDLTLNVASYQVATQVQVNLADKSNGIFSYADIESISCGNTSSGISGGSSQTSATYPCNLTIRAQFSNNSKFLFINQSAIK